MVAFEGLGAGVLPEVPGELVGAREAPGAVWPGADVGLLACQWVKIVVWLEERKLALSLVKTTNKH